MIGQFLLTFREVLEAALITAIMLAYVTRTGRERLARYVWLGVAVAIVASLILGVFVWLAYGLLSEPIRVLFEGSTAILAVTVLTSMIFWLARKGKRIRGEVERRVESITTRGARLALGSFSFVIVFREGLETVLFLTPLVASDPQGTLVGAVFGSVASIVFSYGIFVVGMKIDLRRFFYFTSILLVLLAGGLIGYGVHELIEYAEFVSIDLGWFSDYAYKLDLPSGSLLHHKGLAGSVLAIMFGYSANAEWGRILAHLTYLALVLPFVIRSYRKN